MNRTSPTITPRTAPQVLTKGVTTFRQWADPPPPPSRSRTFKRKCVPPKRPGSADPRFRRTLGSTKISSNPPLEVIPLISKSSSVSNLYSSNEKEDDDFPSPDEEENNFNHIKPNKRYLELNNDSIDSIPLNRKERYNLDYHVPEPKNIRVLESNLILDSEPVHNELMLREIYTKMPKPIRTESKYSQTDVYSNIYSDINDISEEVLPNDILEENSDIIQYITSNYEKTAKYIDELILNRTRSISTIYELEPATEMKQPRLFKSFTRIFLTNNYWMCLEVLGALLFFIALLTFGWYYLLPYLREAFYTWIYPRPPLTVQDYFKNSIYDIISSTAQAVYNLLTAPANRRLM